jgi:uncharacterized protein (DUF488 family)
MAKIYTIGFGGKKQDSFMEILNATGVKKLIDIRLWRTTRFVPWASGSNLAAAFGDRYMIMPELAPTKELLSAYKDRQIDWTGYETIFNELLCERQVEKLFTITPPPQTSAQHLFASERELNGVCFLCSEKTAEQCHRRLVAEYLSKHFQNIEIIHL